MKTIAANVPVVQQDIESALSLIEDAMARLELIAARVQTLLHEGSDTCGEVVRLLTS